MDIALSLLALGIFIDLTANDGEGIASIIRAIRGK